MGLEKEIAMGEQRDDEDVDLRDSERDDGTVEQDRYSSEYESRRTTRGQRAIRRTSNEVQDGEYRVISEGRADPEPTRNPQYARPSTRPHPATAEQYDDLATVRPRQPRRRGPDEYDDYEPQPRRASRSRSLDEEPELERGYATPPPRRPANYDRPYAGAQPAAARFSGWSLVGVGCFGVMVAVIILIAVTAATGVNIVSSIGSFFGSAFNTKVTTGVDLSSQTVVRGLAAQNQLVSVKMTLEKVVTGTQTGDGMLGGLRNAEVLFIARGEVQAGVDLSKLKENDVVVSRSVSGTTSLNVATIHLPPAEIISFKLDEQKSHVFDVKTDSLLPFLASPIPELYDYVRREAETAIKQAAIEDGILSTANDNARRDVELLLLRLGFQEVRFRLVA